MEQNIEHVTITPQEDNMYYLLPDEGYMLLNKRNQKKYSEAITDDLSKWVAVKK